MAPSASLTSALAAAASDACKGMNELDCIRGKRRRGPYLPEGILSVNHYILEPRAARPQSGGTVGASLTPALAAAASDACGTEAGSCLRLTDSCITQLKALGPSRTCNESKEEEEGWPQEPP